MTKLKEKSEFNIHAAELLINNSYYAPSVHCSYYSCFQLLKYTIKTFFGVEYEAIATNSSITGQGTHQYIINYIANELIPLTDIKESRRFKRNFIDLKQYRQESDYENVEVDITKGEKALKLAQEIRNYIKSNF